jgi:serine/threonine protein kinase
MKTSQWHPMGEPASPAEAEALEAVRLLLPDDAVTHAWANLSFIDLDGRTAEVDLLLLCKAGFFVVELKGWHGRVVGDQQSWRHITPGGNVRHERNPLYATDNKAKRLRSLLEASAPNAQVRKAVPFVDALVVMHAKDSVVDLPAIAQSHVVALDGMGITGLQRTLKDVLTATNHHQSIDGPRATQIQTVLKHASLVPTPKNRYVGQYSLEKADPLWEGPSWQDVLAVHPSVPSVKRRVRVFDIPPGASAEVRADIERSARREFVFTQGITHAGIARPTELVTEPVPALIFDYDESEIPLRSYLADAASSLGLAERLDLVRQLAGVLRYAHQRRLVHRALTPGQVYVNTSAASPRLVVRDWQTGRRSPLTSAGSGAGAGRRSATATSFGTADVRGLVAQPDWVYLAPESHRGADDLPAIPLDVYGLGALSYLILTGEAPAANLAELQERLEANGALDPRVADPTVADILADLVRRATCRVEADRLATVDEFLAGLDEVEDALTAPPADAPPEERPRATDPLTAGRGEMLGDRFEVRENRGHGSTGTALLVDDYHRALTGVILKIARDDAAARRLADEAAVIAQLDHPRVVRLLEPPLTVDGRVALLLSDAGKETVAGRLAAKGRATVQELERFGGDLLEAVAHLDARGIFHRDIKPANLGIQPDPGTRQPRLVLFDLSLAREPLANVTSGTRGYLDPYLSLAPAGSARTRRRYDRAAELYAVAATLFEMATTSLPWWADGELGPSSMTDRAVVTPDLFEASLAQPLRTFFTAALAPDVADRFGDVEAMAQEWRRVFAAVDAPDVEVDEASRDAAADAAGLDTPLGDAGLSTRALSGLSRISAHTVGELLRTSPMQVNALSGMGEQYRKEVQQRIRQWRGRLQSPESTTEQAEPLGSDRSVERYLDALIPRASKANAAEVDALRLLLGAPTGSGGVASAESAALGARLGLWPSATDVAEPVGVTRARISQLIDKAATRWQRSRVVEAVRDELFDALRAEEGVASLPELAAVILMRHGSTAEGPDRMRRAAGLIRAVLEADQRSDEPTFAVRRQRGGLVLIAVAPQGSAAAVAETLLADAVRLGEAATAIVAEQPVVSASVARTRLRAVRLRTGELSDDRVIRLATAAAGAVAQSSLHELYRPDLDPQRAASTALRGAVGPSLTVAGVRQRVRQRFPALAELPERPALDAVVEAAVPGLHWNGTAYARPTTASSSAALTSMTRVDTEAPDVVDGYLRASLRRSSALTLCVHPREHDRAVVTLATLYGVEVVDLSARMVAAVRALADRDGVDWPLVLRADAEPTGGDWANLRGLVEEALTEPWRQLLATPRPLLLLHAAPLARYGLTAWLSDLLDQSQPRPAARWLLVPRRGHQAVPTLDGRPVPLGADRWIDLPLDLSSLRPASGVFA